MAGFDFSATISGMEDILANLNGATAQVTAVVKSMYGEAANQTLLDSQPSVPVRSGDLVGSGHIEMEDNGNSWTVSVVYGDGSSTGKIYSYPSSTSKYSDGGFEADGYSGFQEEGTRFFDANTYLGPVFDSNADALLAALKSAGFQEI